MPTLFDYLFFLFLKLFYQRKADVFILAHNKCTIHQSNMKP